MSATSPEIPAVFDAAAFQTATGASAEAMSRLQRYEATLREWNAQMNLVSPNSLAELWKRHFFDSAQLVPLIPHHATHLIDLGSGAGFPGLIIAAGRPELQVMLVESIEKKCAFLRAAVTAMGLESQVTVHRGRAEEIKGVTADVVTARAMASLDTLLHYAQRFTGKSGLCLFPKGRTARQELTEAARSWRIEARLIPSESDPEGSIVAVTSFSFKGRRA